MNVCLTPSLMTALSPHTHMHTHTPMLCAHKTMVASQNNAKHPWMFIQPQTEWTAL